MKTTNFRTVEELNLDINAPVVTPSKVQNDKIVRALKKLSISSPDEALIVKIVSAAVELGVNPQASAWRGADSGFGLRRLQAPGAARARYAVH